MKNYIAIISTAGHTPTRVLPFYANEVEHLSTWAQECLNNHPCAKKKLTNEATLALSRIRLATEEHPYDGGARIIMPYPQVVEVAATRVFAAPPIDGTNDPRQLIQLHTDALVLAGFSRELL